MDIRQLFARKVAQFDGGFGSQVTARGLTFDCPERLNLSQPEEVRAIHRAYVEAGAEVVETNTLGANPLRLAAHGLGGETARIVEAAVGHVRAAGAPVIACSMGTTASFLEPAGTLTFEDAYACFLAQARAAKDAGADVLLTETLTDLAEARAMWLAAAAAGIPFGVSFTFLDNGFTLSGSPASVCALAAQALGAAFVGVNCVGNPDVLLRVLRDLRAAGRLPVVVQPNAGLPEEIDGALRYTVGPEALLPTMAEAVALGAGGIGGCCGTTPAHIRAMAALSKAAPAPAAIGDETPRVCSLRVSLPLADAIASAEAMKPDEIDVTAADAVLLDIRGISPSDAIEAIQEAQLLIKQPLLLRADDAQTLDAALRVYPGIAGVDAPFAPGYGALRM